MEDLKPKLFDCMKDYSLSQFSKDVIAGLIVAIIALPLSIALAIASGVNPERGLYTAIIAGFFISFFGGNSSICCYYLRNCGSIWYRWFNCRYYFSGDYVSRNGISWFWYFN